MAELAERVEAHERRSAPRARQRTGEARAALVATLGRFTGDLVVSIDRGERRPLPCPKDSGAFTELPANYRPFVASYKAFLGLGLIEVVTKGSWRRIPEFGPKAGRGSVERIRPTAAFVALVRKHGIVQGEARSHFRLTARLRPVELRGSSIRRGRDKVRGRSLKPFGGETYQRLVAQMDELNAFIATVAIEGTELRGWTRIFNQADHPEFDWDRGGRLYAKPEPSYQAMSKEERLRLRLEGEAVAEIDIRSSHLAIVYALKGRCLADEIDRARAAGQEPDAYRIGGLPREVVKAWVTATLGKGAPIGRWASEAVADVKERAGICLRNYKVKEVAEAVLARHDVLADLSGIDWARLQFIESKAIVRTMLRLKRRHAIPALPVHDSLIVPRSAWWVAHRALQEELTAVTGQRPIIPKTTPPFERLPAPHRTRFAHLLRSTL